MQIKNTSTDALSQSRAAETAATSHVHSVRGHRAGASRSAGGDQVEVSSLAERASSVIESDSVARSQKIARLQQAYMSGQYKVDPSSVGGAILNSATKAAGES